MKSSIVGFLLLVAVGVESRATPSTQIQNVEMTTEELSYKELIDNESEILTTTTEPMEEIQHDIVKRSTNEIVEEKHTSIDWNAVRTTVSTLIQKLYQFVSEHIKKLFSYASMRASPFLQEILPALIPLSSSLQQASAAQTPVVETTSIDWRSAANNLFDTLVRMQNLRLNEV